MSSEKLIGNITVRDFRNSDAIKAGNVIKRSILPSLSSLSEKDQQEVLGKYDPSNLINRMREFPHWLAENALGEILGVIALDKNEVRTFYVDPLSQGQGIGRLLFNKLLETAKRRNIKKTNRSFQSCS